MEIKTNAQASVQPQPAPAQTPDSPSMGQGRGTDLRPAHSGATVAPVARPTYAGAPAPADAACDKSMKNTGNAACDQSSKSGPIAIDDEADSQTEPKLPAVTVPAKPGNAVASGR